MRGVAGNQHHIKVLFTSGYASNRIVRDGALELGDSLISKPYRRAELLQRVRAALDKAT